MTGQSTSITGHMHSFIHSAKEPFIDLRAGGIQNKEDSESGGGHA